MMPWLLAFVLLQGPLTVSGVVTDGTGATVPAALVTVTAGTVRQVTTTGADGMFTITLPAGTATVSVRAEAPGFGASVREVTLPTSVPVSIALEPQRIAQEVTVTAETSVTRPAIEDSVRSTARHAAGARGRRPRHRSDRARRGAGAAPRRPVARRPRLQPVPPHVVRRRESDDARGHASRAVGVGREPHAGGGRRRAAERRVRGLGLLGPDPDGVSPADRRDARSVR